MEIKMKSLRCIQSKLLLAWIVCVIALPHARAARLYEPVIVRADELGTTTTFIINLEIRNIVVYRYSEITRAWTLIPFQIDEKDSVKGNDYIFKVNPYGNFTWRDELVFFSHDCGDKAPREVWINDPSSRKYERFEVDIFDPYNGSHRYAYLFRTDTPEIHPFNSMKDYIAYNEAEDRVTRAITSSVITTPV